MALLVIFIAAGIYLVRFSPASQYLTAQQLGLFLEAIGFWAPLMFVIIYVVGVCLFLPGTLLTAMGAAIFGPYWGFLYVWTGAMIGAFIFTFFVGTIKDVWASGQWDQLLSWKVLVILGLFVFSYFRFSSPSF
jgi:uncharacterized membrane protein YdjX (TVP38/TMEM64 family)